MITHEKLSKFFGFTSGPWSSGKGFIGAKSADFVKINEMKYDGIHIDAGEKIYGVSSKESESNAKIIAMSPKLLKIAIEEGLQMYEVCLQCFKHPCNNADTCSFSFFPQLTNIKTICLELGKTWDEVVKEFGK